MDYVAAYSLVVLLWTFLGASVVGLIVGAVREWWRDR